MQPLQENIIQAKRIKSSFYQVDVGPGTNVHPLPSMESMKQAVLKEVKILANLLPMVSVNKTKTNPKLNNEKLSGNNKCYSKIIFIRLISKFINFQVSSYKKLSKAAISK